MGICLFWQPAMIVLNIMRLLFCCLLTWLMNSVLFCSAMVVPRLGHTIFHLTLFSQCLVQRASSPLKNVVHPCCFQISVHLLCEIQVLFLASFASPNSLTSFSGYVQNTITSWPSLIPEDSLTLQLYPVTSHLQYNCNTIKLLLENLYCGCTACVRTVLVVWYNYTVGLHSA